MNLITLESNFLSVAVAPDRGARIVSFTDRRTGRDWLAQGKVPLVERADACYGLSEAAGWDECFPTVSPCVVTQSPWMGPLRDHGELWGRSWSVDEVATTVLVATYHANAFRFTRKLVVDGSVLHLDYRVENITFEPMSLLWAAHPLFALRPGERIVLPGVTALLPTYLSIDRNSDSCFPLPWPKGDERIPFPIDRVQSAGAHFAGKFFAVGNVHCARLGGSAGWLEMNWEGISDVGLWITYGQWPSPNDVVHVAIEPTTSPDDELSNAIERDRALTLGPKRTATWRVAVSLRTTYS